MAGFSLKGIALNRSHLCNSVRRVLLFAEITLLTGMLIYTWYRFYNASMPVPIFRRGYYALAAFYWVFLGICLKALKGRAIGEQRLLDTIVSQLIATVLCNTSTYFPLALLSYRIFNPGWLLLMTVAQAAVIVCWCFWANRLIFYIARPMEMFVIAQDGRSTALRLKLDHFRQRYHIFASLAPDADRAEIAEALGRCHAVLLDSADRELRDWVSMECFRRNLFLFLVPGIEDVIVNSARRLHLIDTPMLCTDSHRISAFDLKLKRTADIVISALGLALSLPLTLPCALAVKLCDGGAVFFAQERLTLGGKRFKLVKFRTMIPDAEKHGQRLATERDERITPVGRVLRKTRLDELPQLWNVLRGDMSLVGPRPEVPALAEEYEKALPEFGYRLKVRAGITGVAQVYGDYATTPRDKLLMDIMYIEDYTPSLDLKLLLLTVRALFLTEKTRGVAETEEKA